MALNETLKNNNLKIKWDEEDNGFVVEGVKNKNIEEVTIPDGIVKIDDFAFNECKKN